MATVTLLAVGTGLKAILERAANVAATDTWKLHAYSSSTDVTFSAVIGDVTESVNTTAQDVTPGNLSVALSDPTATLSYSGTISIPVSGGSTTRAGYYLTNQAGTILLAIGATTSESLADGRSFDITSFDVVLQNA